MARRRRRRKDPKIVWDVNTELVLLHTMAGPKPVGNTLNVTRPPIFHMLPGEDKETELNKILGVAISLNLQFFGIFRNFAMSRIHKKFTSIFNLQMSSKPLSDHLETMYDMEALHEIHKSRFQSEEQEFQLPLEDFGSFMIKKMQKCQPHVFHTSNKSLDLSPLIKPLSIKLERLSKNEIEKHLNPVKDLTSQEAMENRSFTPQQEKSEIDDYFYPRVLLESNLDLVLEKTGTHLSGKDKKLMKLNECRKRKADSGID